MDCLLDFARNVLSECEASSRRFSSLHKKSEKHEKGLTAIRRISYEGSPNLAHFNAKEIHCPIRFSQSTRANRSPSLRGHCLFHSDWNTPGFPPSSSACKHFQ
jgi:hypothetical protein